MPLPSAFPAACVRRMAGWIVAGSAAGLIAAAAADTGEPARPLPPVPALDPARVALGRTLFRDVRLSGNGRTSCLHCHDPAHGGASPGPALGASGRMTDTDVPTVYNAALNFRQFWDGRAASLEEQVDHVVRSPVEMASTWDGVMRRLSGDPALRAAFASAYPDGLTPANIRQAIATYERTLLTPDSRFDRYLRGESAALDAGELRGWQSFKRYGCVACHQGVNLGGNMFQKFGVMLDRPPARPGGSSPDLGRYRVTGLEADRGVFKVPGLRNVALTAPYFHDGSAPTLDAAVETMFRLQLGREAPASDRADIVAFLRTLTGLPPATR